MTPGSSYRPGREIARGGMGAVLDARDNKLGRSVAMKVMLRRNASEEEQQRFLQEARVLGQLAHPNIVPVHDVGTDEQGRLFYTMKLVQGVTLHEVIGKLKAGDKDTLAKYPLNALLTIFQKVCDAVAFAHSRGVIHRDLKPQNIMVGEFGEVLVMDWGLAKILPGSAASEEASKTLPLRGQLGQTGPTGTLPLNSPAEEQATLVSGEDQATVASGTGSASAPKLAFGSQQPEPAAPSGTYATLEGAVMGTPHFMSPEQAEGKIAELDGRSDIFSLGGILYALLTLRPPVEGDSLEEILSKVRSGTIAPPTAFNIPSSTTQAKASASGAVTEPRKIHPLPHCPDGKVPAALSAVTMKALTRDKLRRYQTVAEFTRDIVAYQGGFATSAEDANALTLLRLFIHRHRALTAAASVVVLLTIGFLFKVNAEKRAAQASATRATEAEWVAKANEAKANSTLADLRRTAPVFYTQAQVDFADGKRDEALEKLGYAIQLDERVPGYSLLRAHYRQSSLKFAEAATDYRRVLELQPENPSAKVNLTLCEKLLREGAGTTPSRDHKLQLIAALRDQKRTLEAAPLAAEVAPDLNAARTAILARLRDARKLAGWRDSRVSDLPDGTFKLEFDGLVPIDFSVLKGLPVSTLQFNRGDLTNLESLAGLALRELKLDGCPVTDLTPLAGMPLEVLDVSALPGRDGAKIIDLRPLRGMKLRELDLAYSRVADLSPLAGAPLEKLDLSSTRVEDLRPLANCTRLKWLHLEGTEVRDLTPLAGIPVEWLACDSRGVTSIAPLAGTPLRRLFLHETQITDLTALASCRQLEWLDISHTKVTDLAPLAGLPLTLLNCHGLKVTNLTPLRGRPLSSLILTKSSVTDLRPLAECPTLESLGLPDGAKDLSPLRKLPKLTLLSYGMNGGGGLPDRQMSPNQTATAFWRDYDTKSKTGAK